MNGSELGADGFILMLCFAWGVNAVLKVRSVYLQRGQTRPCCFLNSTCGTYGMTCVWVWRRTRQERDIRFSSVAHIRVLLQASVCTKAIRDKSPHGLTIRANDVNVIPDTAELLMHPRFIRFCTNAPIHNINYVKLMNIKARFRISAGP